MKKTKEFIRKYLLLLIFISVFSWFVLPVSFQNNENLNIVSAEHVDSGSILSSILQMSNKLEARFYYNQNVPYHTAFYGFPFNSLLFWIFTLISAIFSIPFEDTHFFALAAKLFNFVIAVLSIFTVYNLINKIFKYQVTHAMYLTLFCLFTPFVHYTFHIKPDILGLLFSLISVTYLYFYLNNPKVIKYIIAANIFGGLAVLCKQPHIFIVFPLFIGSLISLENNNLKIYFKKLLRIYFVSGAILLLLTFLIHPYMFLELDAFLSNQRALLGMTAASVSDNLSWWLNTYLSNPLLLLTALMPFLFLFVNLFKKQKNINIKFLSLLSIYGSTYILWLTLKVGPMRFVEYLIPILPISLLLYFYLFDHFIFVFLKQKNFKYGVIYFFILSFFAFIFIKSAALNMAKSQKSIESAYDFKETITYKSTKELENDNKKFSEVDIIYSISLPIDTGLYKSSTNTWQLPSEEAINLFEPEYLFIDLTVYWEKPYEYWNNVAKQNGLNKEKVFITNLDKENNIILFYK